MNNRFVVAIDPGLQGQQDAITLYFKGKGWQFWHWLENVWLLANMPLDVTPRSLWKELNELPGMPNHDMVVIKTNGAVTFWGTLPSHAWEWMMINWGLPG